MVKNLEKVLRLIQQHPQGIDDDEVAQRANVQPRQQVYQICKRLEIEGKIRRESVEKPGKRRKIHNFPVERPLIVGATSSGGNSPQDSQWRRRIAMLEAATGRDSDDLLNEAVQDLALKILRRETT